MPSTAHTAVLLFGPPGSGKSTHGRALGELPRLLHYDMGENLRQVDENTELGEKIRAVTAAGDILPDDVVMSVFDEDLEQLGETGDYYPEKDVLLLDGLPRTPGQAEALRARLQLLGVVELAIDDRLGLFERLRERGLENGRIDDVDASVIEERIRRYERESRPVIELFEPRSVETVNASNAPLEVLANVVGAMMSLLSPRQDR